MKKECTVILLAVDKGGVLAGQHFKDGTMELDIDDAGMQTEWPEEGYSFNEAGSIVSYDVLLVSDDELKAGDYFYDHELGSIGVYDNTGVWTDISKIVVSTDPRLGLPGLNDMFLDTYAKVDGRIDTVEVEYDGDKPKVFLSGKHGVASVSWYKRKKQTIQVNFGIQPILDIDEDGMGLNRDRKPDSGWTELRRTKMTSDNIKTVELTNELKQILLEDLAFAYGQHSREFTDKLVEFGLFKTH